mgnify:CR=1 FL=1
MPHRYTPVEFHRYQQKHILNHFCTVAPMSHNYAICMEYMKKWFLEKFPKDFFSYFFVDGSHVFGETTRLPKDKIMIKGSNDTCTCAMTAQLDDQYDRTGLDLNLFGLEQFINTTPIDRSFIQDPINDRYVMMKMDMTLMNFTFRIKCPSRAKQLDLFKFMKLAFRIGLSETRDAINDYLLPYSLMLSIASDNGFKIDTEKAIILNPIEFLTWLNQHSFLPIIFRFNNMTGREDYYVRMDDVPIRLGFESISKDDGNRAGHLLTDFNIEMNINARFPGMQLYIYHTKTEQIYSTQTKSAYAIDGALMIAFKQGCPPPAVNERGWLKYIESDYQADEPGPFEINMAELFEGELLKFINKHKTRFISPEVFMDIRVYCDDEFLDTEMNWLTMMLSVKSYPPKLITSIIIYIDTVYLNDQRIIDGGHNKSRTTIQDN